MRSSFRFAVTALALPACATARFAQVNAPPHALASKAPAAVEVLSVPPSRQYLELGTLSVDYFGASDDKRRDAMRRAAAEHGCDALITRDHVTAGICVVYVDAQRS